MRENVLLPLGQGFSTITTLVLQHMANVLATQKPKKSIPPGAKPGQLKIDKGRITLLVDKNVGFLGQIVVNHTGTVNLP